MASDNHAHYARIGFTVFIGAVAIAATLVYFGGFHDADSEVLLETYSDTPVNGLAVGSPVNLFGVKVGEVREISFALVTYGVSMTNACDFSRISIVMALDRKRISGVDVADEEELAKFLESRVCLGLRATVQSNAITGMSRIDLVMREGEPIPDFPNWKPRHPLIPPAPSLFDNFSVAATKLMNRFKTMDFDAVWSNVNRMADSAARTAEMADALLQSSRTDIRQIVQDVGDASSSFREMSHLLRDNPSLLLRPRDPEPIEETR